MIFIETKLSGAFIVELERREDHRGFFARAFCQHEFADHGLQSVIVQANIAFNKTVGTLRGMHFQSPPAAETKLVRVSKPKACGVGSRTCQRRTSRALLIE